MARKMTMISATPRSAARCLVAVLLAGQAATSPAVLAGSGGTAVPPCLVQFDELSRRIPEIFVLAGVQYDRLLASVKDDPKLPRTVVDGKVKTVDPTDWTSGFFPGSLWYLYEYTRDPKWLAAATNYTERLDSIKNFGGSHDIGFILGCSYGNGYRLTSNGVYRAVLLQGATSLASRFDPRVGLIRSWDRAPWKYPVIIDNMMNLELLTWAAREGGDARLLEMAKLHADKTRQNHFRADYSSFHLVDYNPTNGAVLEKRTVQGAADGSAWARGQAWALYGFTMMARETHDPAYLAQATNIANFIRNHPRMPADKVPYWDFDAPDIPNAPRDASAAAIVSSALIELSGLVRGEAGRQYLAFARAQLLSLSSPAYLAKPGENGNFILKHSVGHLPKNREVDVPLSYADYYFLEALLRYHRCLAEPERAMGARCSGERDSNAVEFLHLDGVAVGDGHLIAVGEGPDEIVERLPTARQ
jgi:hypothetical protein